MMVDFGSYNSFDISLEGEDLEGCISKLLGLARPSWGPNGIDIKHLDRGYTNRSFRCSHGEEELVVRVFGNDVELFVDRRTEIVHVRLLAAIGLGPSIVCSFNNGYVYKFVQGETYKPKVAFDEDSARLVCTALVKFNSASLNAAMNKLALNSSENFQLNRQPVIFKKLTRMWSNCAERLDDVERDERYRHILGRKNEIKDDLHILQKHAEGLGMPVVFGHGDWRNDNLIQSSAEDILTPIDLEMSDYNYEPYDLAFYFSLGNYHDPSAKTFNWGPSPEQEMLWVRIYLECKAEREGKDPISIREDDVKKWFFWTKKMYLVCILNHVLYTWFQATRSSLPVDFLRLADVFATHYDDIKDGIMAM